MGEFASFLTLDRLFLKLLRVDARFLAAAHLPQNRCLGLRATLRHSMQSRVAGLLGFVTMNSCGHSFSLGPRYVAVSLKLMGMSTVCQ